MHLAIRHRTLYRYVEPAFRVTQALRLWPAPVEGQRSCAWRVEVNGLSLKSITTDGFANPVATHTLDGPVSEISIEVSGQIETSDRQGVVSGTIEQLPTRFFLIETPLTNVDDSIRALAAEVSSAENDIARLHALCNHVRDRVDYIPGQTDAETTASEALAHRAGVCQDHAHLLISAARVMGYPARYVSGYLCAGIEGDDAASHAWAEVFVADIGWIGFDAANRICPNEHYVRIACGRDYHDAAPVRGVHQGGKSESLEVSVSISESERIATKPIGRRLTSDIDSGNQQ